LRRLVADVQYPKSLNLRKIDYDTDRVDEVVLALMYLTLHDEVRSWKGFDWEALNRLHEKGLIGDPVSKAKSVVLTEEGMAESERLFWKYFSRGGQP
jgi:hypothetical protein